MEKSHLPIISGRKSENGNLEKGVFGNLRGWIGSLEVSLLVNFGTNLMKTNFKEYDFEKSRERLSDILKSADKNFEEVESIPLRDSLTFNNGYYVNKTSALYVDLRDSSYLPKNYQRPVLARIYRSYISEVVAIINGNEDCAEISIEGDCVWGIFDTQYQYQINNLLDTAACIFSMIEYLNCQFKKQKIDPVEIGIGISFGRVLMIKAGYNGSGLNDVVWLGEVINDASKLCSKANKTSSDKSLMVSNDFYSNLKDEYKKLFTFNRAAQCYHGDIVNISINDWLKDNKCK